MTELANISLISKQEFLKTENTIILFDKNSIPNIDFLNSEETDFIKSQIEKKISKITIQTLQYSYYIIACDSTTENTIDMERIRIAASDVEQKLLDNKACSCQIVSYINKKKTLAAIEGLALSSYRFALYFKNNTNKHTLQSIKIQSTSITETDIALLTSVIEGVYNARDYVNEPLSTLNAIVFAERIAELAPKAGFLVTIHDKEWIEKEKMGGLLAVNRGSIDPPRFVEIEWNPQQAKNKKPIVLIGKGIVFDTGGISLKPTANMDYMKSDMGGAAAVAGAMYTLAKNNTALHIKAYIPITDNRPDGNAYVPGDIIKMHNGLYVEVLNTDAEGRMILADALSYAQNNNPELVIDIATLTGAASMAVGEHAVVTMGTANDSLFQLLDTSGHEVCERIVRFPIWEEYGEDIKSTIADLKNVGGQSAGAITAGKFLEHFTNYPWIHLDISGSSFFKTRKNYKGIGATAFGVRLLYTFIKNIETNFSS